MKSLIGSVLLASLFLFSTAPAAGSHFGYCSTDERHIGCHDSGGSNDRGNSCLCRTQYAATENLNHPTRVCTAEEIEWHRSNPGSATELSCISPNPKALSTTSEPTFEVLFNLNGAIQPVVCCGGHHTPRECPCPGM
jgi:hypothetical protein